MSESVAALTNQAIECSLAGKVHKFRQLTLAELFGKFEADVKNDWRVRVKDMAATMESEDRVPFLVAAALNPPTTDQSANLVRDKMNSASGISLILSLTHLKEGRDDVLPEILVLMADPADRAAVGDLIKELTGTAGVKMEAGEDGPKLSTGIAS